MRAVGSREQTVAEAGEELDHFGDDRCWRLRVIKCRALPSCGRLVSQDTFPCRQMGFENITGSDEETTGACGCNHCRCRQGGAPPVPLVDGQVWTREEEWRVRLDPVQSAVLQSRLI